MASQERDFYLNAHLPHLARAIVRPTEEGEMRVVGIDTHKATLAACAIDDVGQVLAEATFPNDPAGFAALARLYSGKPFTCGESLYDGATGRQLQSASGC